MKQDLISDLPARCPGTREDLDDLARIVLGRTRKEPRDQQLQMLVKLKKDLARLAKATLDGVRDGLKSPSAGKLVRQLERVAMAANELEAALDALSPTFRELLSNLYRSRQILDPDTKVIRRLSLGRENAEFAAGAIRGVAQDYLDQWRGNQVSGYVPPDRRGPQRAYHRLFGDPRMFLADQVARLLVTYQPELKLTAEPSGDLYGVVMELWTYATGLPEDGYDLRKFARRSARSAETLKAAQKCQTQIADLEGRLQTLNGPPMRYEEMRPLLRQLDTLQTRYRDLVTKAQEASFGR